MLLKATFTKRFLLTDQKGEEKSHSCGYAHVSGIAQAGFPDVGRRSVIVFAMIHHSVPSDLLVRIRRQLHLHIAGVVLHVLGQEACVGAFCPIKLYAYETQLEHLAQESNIRVKQICD